MQFNSICKIAYNLLFIVNRYFMLRKPFERRRQHFNILMIRSPPSAVQATPTPPPYDAPPHRHPRHRMQIFLLQSIPLHFCDPGRRIWFAAGCNAPRMRVQFSLHPGDLLRSACATNAYYDCGLGHRQSGTCAMKLYLLWDLGDELLHYRMSRI